MSTPTGEKKNYKTTLNLPQTAFPMEAKLVQNEPARLQKWKYANLYQQVLDARKDEETWLLHDVPPFANGDIHIGHLINKTLKDVFIRFRTMQGYKTPYIPGWDCHGLPIEHKIQEQLGSKWREMQTADLRKLCFDFASKYAGVQSEQFQRLGILGDWAHPYLTMAPEYEACTLEVFARFVEAGLVYKKLKPVPWSVSNQTALADAELEYQDVTDPSVYVEFPLYDLGSLLESKGFTSVLEGIDTELQKKPTPVLLVWTTTPWTLPANLAVAVNPDVEYAVVQYVRDGNARLGILAADLIGRVFKLSGTELTHRVVTTLPGKELLGMQYGHPFIDRTGKLVAAEYVTTTDGTGLVHTAPGHGEEDYELGMREKLDVYSPVLANGRFDLTVPEWIQGKTVWEANPLITEHLREKVGLLFATQPILHSYPHDWRSKKPIIFRRATEQWFVSVDKPYSVGGDASRSMRDRAMESIASQVQFVPQWGQGASKA